MENKKFSARDAKLIRDNPGRSAEELFALGLSKAAYNRLANTEITSTQKLEPVNVEVALLPIQTGRTPNHVVRMLNKMTSAVIELGYRAASRVSQTYPDKFEILSK